LNPNSELYQKWLKHFGEETQMRMAQEECGELIAAISHFIRGKKGACDLLQEIADVEILIEQLRIIFSDHAINKEKNFKLNRMQGYLDALEAKKK